MAGFQIPDSKCRTLRELRSGIPSSALLESGIWNPAIEDRIDSAKLPRRLPALPEGERAADDEQDVEHDAGARERDADSGVEEEHQRDQPGDDHRRVGHDLFRLHGGWAPDVGGKV